MLTVSLVSVAYLLALAVVVRTAPRVLLKSSASALLTAGYALAVWQLWPGGQRVRADVVVNPAPAEASKPGEKPPLAGAALKRIDVVEEALRDPNSELRKLHETAVATFVTKSGFGRNRMILPEELKPILPSFLSTEDLENEPRDVDPAALERLHLISLMSFAAPPVRPDPAGPNARPAPRGLGHLVRKMEPPAPWELKTLDLVGLTVHETPAVYTAPRAMTAINPARQVQRAPDLFEAAGLERLRQGEDFFAREKAGELRVLGAIRAAAQCTSCHDVERGHLLGAFSYSLTKAESPRK